VFAASGLHTHAVTSQASL